MPCEKSPRAWRQFIISFDAAMLLRKYRERGRTEGAWQLQRDDDDGLGIGVVMGLNRDTHRNRRRRELEDPSLVSDARTMDRVSTSSLSHIYGKQGRS